MSAWLFPYERELVWQRRRRALVLLLVAFLLLLLLDGAIFRAATIAPIPEYAADRAPVEAAVENGQDHVRFNYAVERLEEHDFYRSFRVVGTLWPWILVGCALVAHGTARGPRMRGLAGAGLMIIVSAVLSGGAAEVTRTVIGRLRPLAADPIGTHQFAGLLERFQYPNLGGFPSSHATVAFGGAFMVAFVYPRAGGVALLAAVGCAFTRLVVGAHFASDVFASALLGYAVARLLRPGGWPGLRPRTLLP